MNISDLKHAIRDLPANMEVMINDGEGLAFITAPHAYTLPVAPGAGCSTHDEHPRSVFVISLPYDTPPWEVDHGLVVQPDCISKEEK